MHLKL
jgi:hypothetical protein